MLRHIDRKQINPIMADRFRLVISALFRGNQTINALSNENATIIQADMQPKTCHRAINILQLNAEYTCMLKECFPFVT
jgi:hypothetical protein